MKGRAIAESGSASVDAGAAADALIGVDGQRAAYRALLGNRNYRLWFFAALSSGVGDWAGLFALQALVLVLSEPGSRRGIFALGGIMMARLLPSLLVGPVSGVLADRYDRKRLMVGVDIMRGVLFVFIAFSRDLVALFALTFLVECFSLLFISSKDAVLPSLVERRHLQQANQLNLLVTYGTLPIGGILGSLVTGVAALLVVIGLEQLDPLLLILLLDAATFFASALLVSRLALPPAVRRANEAGESEGALAELRQGFTFIQGLPLIRALILGVVGIAFGAGVVVTLGPEFVRGTLGRPETDWQLMITAVGLGLVAGIVGVGFLPSRWPRERIFPLGLIATAALAVGLATLTSFGWALGFGALLGAASGVSFVLGYTLLHAYTRDDIRGKTFAAFYTGTRLALFASLGLAPFVAGLIGVFSIGVGGVELRMSGVRVTILAGGLFGLFAAVSAGRAMWRASGSDKDDDAGSLRLPAPRMPEESAGLLIAFEGVEGAGKSTQVANVAKALRARGHEVVITREPGGPPVAERLRKILLDADGEMDNRTEVLLYAAARAEHVAATIRPALDAGAIVLCDRFIDSSLAYQGFARAQGAETVGAISRWATAGLRPEMVVLLRLDVEEGLHRVTTRADGGGVDRLEREKLDFHRRVAEGYETLAANDPERFIVVDGQAEPGAVTERILGELVPRLQARSS